MFQFLKPIIQPLTQTLREWTKPNRTSLAGGVVTDLTRSKSDLMLENALLRQQVIVLDRQVKRPQLTWRDRGIIVLLSSFLQTWKEALLIVQPETVVRWHRDIYRLIWRLKSKSDIPPGRPPISAEKRGLIQRLARENHLWGAERIRGELLKLGVNAAKSTVQKYSQKVWSLTPGTTNWSSFLRNHASEIWACDFLQTYDVLFRSIFLFVIIELGSRRIVYFNVTRHPTDAWVAQQLKQATPFDEHPIYLIQDNDGKFGSLFASVVEHSHIEVLLTPVEAPKANAFCERFMGSVRRECLDYILILSEHHFYRTIKEYVTYFNNARPHQGIAQKIPCRTSAPEESDVSGQNKILSYPVLGGLHHDYRRAA